MGNDTSARQRQGLLQDLKNLLVIKCTVAAHHPMLIHKAQFL